MGSPGPSERRDNGKAPAFVYFAPRDVLIPRVDRHCTMRFCEAMAERGFDARVVSLNVRLSDDEPRHPSDIAQLYGLARRLQVTILPSPDRQAKERPRLLAAWRLIAYSSHAFRTLILRRKASGDRPAVLYFKNHLLGAPFLVLRRLSRGRILLLFEAHGVPAGRLDRAILRRMDGVVAVNAVLARALAADPRLDPRRVVVAHQGVDLERVEDARMEKDAARRRLGLPLERKLAVYTGKVHPGYREVELMLEAARLLPDGVDIVIVGGRNDHADHFRRKVAREGISNVHFPGFVPPTEVLHYQTAADVLVSYYPSELALDERGVSPGKLFEYMAAKRPIVTADYEALREVLHPEAAVFVERDDPRRLAEGIGRVLADSELAEQLAGRAFLDVREYTWKRRAERVDELIRAAAQPERGAG